MDHIEQMLTKLERSFGKPRQAVNLDQLHRAYGKEKSVPKLVKVCAQTIFTAGMPRIRVGVYRTGGSRNGLAWLERPTHIPAYGSRDFRDTRFTMGFKKAAQSAPFATLAFAVAHELSHIILYSVNHTLQHDERAVDLTAMHFGFAEAYAEGKVRVVDTWETKQKRHSGRVGTVLDVLGLNQTDTTFHTTKGEVGYLSTQEMYYACSWITHRRL